MRPSAPARRLRHVHAALRRPDHGSAPGSVHPAAAAADGSHPEGAETKWAFFKGEIVPIGEAQVSVMTNTLHYGTGCFGGLRACAPRPCPCPRPPHPTAGADPNRAADWSEDHQELFCFRLVDHYTRFLRSAKLLLADIPYDAQALADITVELLRQENFYGDVYIRPLLYKADLHGPLQLHDMEDEITIYALPRAGAPSEQGLRLTTSSWRRIDDTMMPARGKLVGAYVNSALIKSEALLAGYDDAVVLTQDGHVSECSGSNLFLIRDGVLCAHNPSLSPSGL